MLNNNLQVIIRPAKLTELSLVKNFLLEQCKILYHGAISPNQYQDLEQLQEKYFSPEKHTLLGAFLPNGQLVGTIAISAYNDRIDCIKGRYTAFSVAEVGRCYLAPELRRVGIGSLLFQAAVHFAQTTEYKYLYLHTHKFLPGGYNFWLKKGFTILLDQADVHQTVHMELDLANFEASLL